MNWLFEPAASLPRDLPTNLFAGPAARTGGTVALLDFFAVDSGSLEEPAAVSAASPQAATLDKEDEARDRARKVAAMMDAAREEARSQMREELQAAMQVTLTEQQARVDRVCAEFARDRQRYFAAAEVQVVKLALAMARRVLEREVRENQMHLAAAVRTSLAKVHEESGTTLRCCPAESDSWRELLRSEANASVAVCADERLLPGDCVLETAIGRIELGVAVQLAEIERGFDELMPQRGT